MTKKKQTIIQPEPVEPSPPTRHPASNVLISHTPRVGSTLLLDLLGVNGGAGVTDLSKASLYFGYGEALSDIGEAEIDNWLLTRHADVATITVKTDWSYLDHLQARNGLVENLLSRFDAFIHVQRSDVVAQAVSWYVATKTGQYNSFDTPKVNLSTVTYDRGEIASRVSQIERDQQRWLSWYHDHKIMPHFVTYEALVEAPNETLEDVYDYLGIKAPKKISAGLLQKLPGHPDFIERYNKGE